MLQSKVDNENIDNKVIIIKKKITAFDTKHRQSQALSLALTTIAQSTAQVFCPCFSLLVSRAIRRINDNK